MTRLPAPMSAVHSPDDPCHQAEVFDPRDGASATSREAYLLALQEGYSQGLLSFDERGVAARVLELAISQEAMMMLVQESPCLRRTSRMTF